MQLLVAFLFCAVVPAMFSRTLDWRGHTAFFAVGLLVTGIYYVDSGAWG